MLDIGKTTHPTPKCLFTSTTLPAYLDSTQQPTKRKPFSTLLSHPYYSNLTLLSPSTLTSSPSKTTKYAKLRIPLLGLLQDDFFTKYIKTGNILLLSAPLYIPTTSSSATFRLVEGVLRIEVDRATYERCGLQGTRIPDPHGRKHQDSKFGVEMNLRLPSMLAGKPGFERLKKAAEGVLGGEVDWLFWDVEAKGDGDVKEVLGEKVDMRDVGVEETELGKVMVPPFPSDTVKEDQDTVTELLEWISLAMAGSPRVQEGDRIDHLLSRYAVPDGSEAQDLKRQSWRGFLSNGFVADVFGEALKRSKDEWFAVCAQGFEGQRVVVLKTRDGRALTYEI